MRKVRRKFPNHNPKVSKKDLHLYSRRKYTVGERRHISKQHFLCYKTTEDYRNHYNGCLRINYKHTKGLILPDDLIEQERSERKAKIYSIIFLIVFLLCAISIIACPVLFIEYVRN